MFIDHAKIHVKAGDGGPGMVSFHTEKFVTNGGPDGGDGGKGGDVVFVAVSRLSNLSSFRFKHKFVAEDGAKGMNRKMYGKGGADLEIAVPVGTVIKDVETDRILADMTEDGQRVVIARGGKGGLGNMHYANAVRQAPQFARAGIPGEELDLYIELKLIADVGLVGYPNAGIPLQRWNQSSALFRVLIHHMSSLISPVLSRMLIRVRDWDMISCAI